jgi:hypothetical protein
MNQQQKATSVISTGELINLPLLKTAIGIWSTVIKGTEWLIAIQLDGKHGKTKTFSHLLDLRMLNSYIILINCG